MVSFERSTSVTSIRNTICLLQDVAAVSKKYMEDTQTSLNNLRGKSDLSHDDEELIIRSDKAKKSFRQSLALLEVSRSLANQVLEESTSNEVLANRVEKAHSTAVRLRNSVAEALGDFFQKFEENATSMKELRHVHMSQDKEAIQKLKIEAPRKERLQAIVERLRELESSIDFQCGLLQCQKTISDETDYTLENFAYGSTPFTSWMKVFDTPSVQTTLKEIRESDKEYTVFGSSVGWLAFYGALVESVRTSGVELLPFLVEHARGIASDHQLKQINFHCQDMLTYDIGRCGVLLLTSQCWELELIEAVHSKIARELPLGSLIVDYSNKLDRLEGVCLEESVPAPVSWNDQNRFFIFRKVKHDRA